MVALAICICCPPAMRGSTLFSDLGPAGNIYSASSGYFVLGGGVDGTSNTLANLFTVSGSGTLPVTGVDLAVSETFGLHTFCASIWTDSGGLPGAQVAGAYWSLSADAEDSFCCALTSITGITGVTLTGGQQYFMVLGPLSLSDSSETVWNGNSQGVTGLELYSSDGGTTWSSYGTGSALGAFDVTSNTASPEPATWPILLALAGAGLWLRFRKRSVA